VKSAGQVVNKSSAFNLVWRGLCPRIKNGRVYGTEHGQPGVPPKQLIRDALLRTMSKSGGWHAPDDQSGLRETEI